MSNPNSAAQRSFAAEPYDSVAAVLASKQITAALVGQRIHTKDGYAFDVLDAGNPLSDAETAGGAKLSFIFTGAPATHDCFGIPLKSEDVDYTAKMQRLISQPLFILDDDLEVSVSTLYAVSGTKGHLGKAVIKELSSASVVTLTPVFYIGDVHDVEYHGGVINGNRSNILKPPIPSSQDGGMHGVAWRGGRNVRWFNPTSINCWTDGIYVNAPEGSTGAIIDPYLDNNGRQALSVIQHPSLHVHGGHFLNSNGTPPEAGIDIEPNHAHEPVNIRFTGTQVIQGNAQRGFTVNITTREVFITSERMEIYENGLEALRLTGDGIVNFSFEEVLSDGVVSFGGSGCRVRGERVKCTVFSINFVKSGAGTFDVDIDNMECDFASTSGDVNAYRLAPISAGQRRVRHKRVVVGNTGGSASTSVPFYVSGGGDLDIEIGEVVVTAGSSARLVGTPKHSKLNFRFDVDLPGPHLRVAGSKWNAYAEKTVAEGTQQLILLENAQDCDVTGRWDGFSAPIVRVNVATATRNKITAIGRNGTATPISFHTSATGNVIKGSMLHLASGSTYVESKGTNVGVGNYPLSLND